MSNPNFLESAKRSVSFGIYLEVNTYLRPDDGDHVLTKVAKITANFIAAPVLALAAIVESVVRAILSIPAKFIHLFLPHSLAEGFHKHVLEYLTFGSALSAVMAAHHVTSLVTNFYSSTIRENAYKLINSMGEEAYYGLDSAIKYHFFK